MWRLVLLFLISLALIVFNYKKERQLQKSLLLLFILLYIFSIGYSGAILTRAIPPLFFAHIIALVIGYIGFILYLWRDKLRWYFLLAPLLPIATYILLNYFDGSRYEALRDFSIYYCT